MKAAAIYARVSSDKQKEEHTIASQTAALRALAQEQQCDVPAEWVFEAKAVEKKRRPVPVYRTVGDTRRESDEAVWF